ncbi:MAG: hypothetical protein GX021_02180 [Tissierellia bacterium]|nr:hypothetical protein [Tissierellia bacterium]
MYIRRFLIYLSLALLIIGFSSIIVYRNVSRNMVGKIMDYDHNQIGSTARIKDGKIQIYRGNKWEDLLIKGVQVNSFTPGYARNKSSVDKSDVMTWLEQISGMNANVITIPSIQPPSFYNAIYDYNLNAERPLYIIHEIPIDEKALLKHFDAYNKEIYSSLKKDIARTIDVVHGNRVIFDNSRHHAGLYLKDISAYVLGYIIGTNTNAEFVTLTNLRHPHITSYDGKFFSVNGGKPFEVFIAELLDFAAEYEIDKYEQFSLLSYICTMETDPIEHKNESNSTKNANIDLENIIDKSKSKIFASYAVHPNTYDFFDFGERKELAFYNYLIDINTHHSIPVIVSDIGIPSSRGMSKVDIDEGFNRGNVTEIQQGEQIVQLLDYIYKSGCIGGVIYSWQDDWSKTTAFNLMEDYSDQSSSTYWYDAQASDESFGLMAFRPKGKEYGISIDGDFTDWDYFSSISKHHHIKVTSDTSYLYLYFKKEGLSLTHDKIYIGLDITPLSGSKNWEDKVDFPMPVDFILEFQGYNEARIVVHERYNLFNYLYKYYSNIIEKQVRPPDPNSKIFSAIYLLNRKHFYFRETNTVEHPVYYETGRLVYGNSDQNSRDYNSLADFNKEGDAIEIRIPWMLINVKNLLKKQAQGDFYSKGLDSYVYIKNIGISLYYEGENERFTTEKLIYKIPSYKHMEYDQVLKRSYYIVRDYWKDI